MHGAVNKVTLAARLKSYRRHPFSFAVMCVVLLAAIITAAILFFIIAYILVKGVPNLKPSLFAWEYSSENVSMTPALINTLILTLLTLAFAVPIGICAAVYLTEYARRGSRLVEAVRLTTETLAGIPSIVYGLVGYLLFNVKLGWGYSLLGGALTLAMMILPLIVRTSEEAILAVPDSYREGSFGLGAGRLRTVVRIVLPSAASGIVSGVILGIGRVFGETAALIFTAGTVAGIADGVLGSGRTLSVHMYSLLSEGLHTDEAYATAVVLLVLSALINGCSAFAAKKVESKK